MSKMTKTEREKIMRDIVEAWGEDNQIICAIEEMSELTKELCKLQRIRKYGNTPAKEAEVRANIIEEVADVLITVGNLQTIYGIDEVEKAIDFKLRRGAARVAEWKKGQKEQ